MSTLLKALRRAQQPQLSAHIPAMGLPMPREEERSPRRIGWLLAPWPCCWGRAPTMAGI